MDKLTLLITGATDGIGRQTALDCARQGMPVLVHARSLAREAGQRGRFGECTGHLAGRFANGYGG